MSYARQLLLEIAKETGRPASMVEEHIKTLEDNWYDTKESLMSIDEKTLDSLNFPKRLQNMITQKLNISLPQQPQQQQQQQQLSNQQPVIVQQQNQSQKLEKMQIEEQKIDSNQITNNQQQNIENQLIDNVHREIDDNDKFIAAMQMLYKILYNINQNPLEEKLRSLKRQNQKLQEIIFKYESCLDLLRQCQFKVTEELVELPQYSIDQIYLMKVMKVIQDRAEQIARLKGFDPTKSYSNMATLSKPGSLLEKAGVQSFKDQLDDLVAKRNQIMSQPVKDRNLKCLLKNNITLHEPQQTDDVDYKDLIKKAALKLSQDEIGFSSRRKQEYDNLIAQPCYSQTIIRVKFVNDIVLECTFSPKETIKTLVDFVRQNLEDPSLDFYLYDTPPLRKFLEKDFNKTFYDIEAIPGANFYFGLKDDSLLKKQKYFLKQNLIDQAFGKSN